MKSNSSLLVGNDINSLNPGYDWKQLLKDLINRIGANNEIVHIKEQFPLLYEEICTFANSRNTASEGEIKQFIADKVQKLNPNHIHAELTNLGIKEILTTNYEFSLEKSVNDSFTQFVNNGIVAETKYSIFRNTTLDGLRFWHIHGDAQSSGTIALGYEHYSGYLQNMRNYVVSGSRDSYKNVKFEPLVKRLRNKLDENYKSWLDIFFTNDVHIIGLGLEFVEIHLWWLLTYRARAKNISKLLSRNKIYYYYPQYR